MNKGMPDSDLSEGVRKYEAVRSENDWRNIQIELFQAKLQESTAEKLRRPFNAAKLQIFEQFVPRDRSCKILEAGCFTAAWGEYFANLGHDVLCVDLPEVLEVTRRDIDVTYMPCDLNEDFPEGEFDIIICTQVIEHIPRDFELLKGIYSHLSEGGLAFVDSVTAMPPTSDINCNHGHMRAYPGYSLEALMRTAGFEIVFSAHLVLKATKDENVFVVGKRTACDETCS